MNTTLVQSVTLTQDSWESFSAAGLRNAASAPVETPTEAPPAPDPVVVPKRKQNDEPMPDFSPPTKEPQRCPNIDPDTDLPTCKKT